MKYPSFLITSVLLPTAFAGLVQRLDRRISRKTNPNTASTGPAGLNSIFSNTSVNVQYSQNWAGAVIETPPAGSTFTSVSASFTVPTASGSGAASAWVGIDGDTYTNSILQTGLDFVVTNGKTTYDAWYEWYPDYAYDFSGITFSAGDSVTISVKASSTTSGTAVIENNTTGKTVSKTLSSSAKLGGQNAEWIVEDFEQNGQLVDFANFGTVTFTGASAGTSTGKTVGIGGATILDIEQGSSVLTSTSTSGSDTVVVKHT